jgi:hypothetical protein
MTTTTKTYLITNRITCSVLGLYEAATEDEAVLAMIRDAGYRDAEDEAEVLDASVEKLRDELRVTEVDVPAAIATLAVVMVKADRESGDCIDDVRADADAGDTSHWDRLGVIAVADDAGVERALARTIAETKLDLVRDAYAAAWRAAVEAASAAV